jgi:hypothetical protein
LSSVLRKLKNYVIWAKYSKKKKKKNHCAWTYLFFDNLFSFLKFYSGLFKSNLKPIASDFLVNGGIEKIHIKITKRVNMSGVLEVSGKIHFDPLTFKTTQIIWFQCFNFFQI